MLGSRPSTRRPLPRPRPTVPRWRVAGTGLERWRQPQPEETRKIRLAQIPRTVARTARGRSGRGSGTGAGTDLFTDRHGGDVYAGSGEVFQSGSGNGSLIARGSSHGGICSSTDRKTLPISLRRHTHGPQETAA